MTTVGIVTFLKVFFPVIIFLKSQLSLSCHMTGVVIAVVTFHCFVIPKPDQRQVEKSKELEQERPLYGLRS